MCVWFFNGGYASLAFSKLLKLDSAILFSPQYSIDESFDTRWSSYSNEIEFVYRIDRNSVGENCKFYIFYDNKNADSLHVDRLIDVIAPGNIELFKIPFSGHPVAHYLSEVSLNKNLIEFFIKNLRVDEVDFLEGRRLSKSYFQNLAQFLDRKGKFKSALAMIDRAIFIDPEKANFYLIKSDVLEKMGRLDDAISYINKALSIDGTNKHYLFRLGKIQEKKRLVESEKISADAG